MILNIIITSLLASIIRNIIHNLRITISTVSIIVGIIRTLINDSASLKKQEILGMPTMHKNPHCHMELNKKLNMELVRR